ncbi:MAG: transposase [Betaproteobacteria bacterium]|nr:transposase [Betaproteobacteria bacterium]
MKVTRTLLADVPAQLASICKAAGYIRADIWRRYGALGNVGVSASAVRSEIVEKKICDGLPIDGTIRAETTKDIVNDILTCKAAAKLKVRQAIAKRTSDENERKRLYTLLRSDEWLADPFLHRQMRKHFRHGKSRVANQFIVRSDRYSTEVVNGKLLVTVRIAKKYGDNIVLTTTSSGKNVDLSGSNLRIIVKDGRTAIHYAAEKGPGRECGKQVIGVDKGYTEAFTDSDDDRHGQSFGKVMTEYSDKVAATGKQRNKLHALEKKHREAGRISKADRIKKNNLGRKKLDARKETTQKQLRTIAYQAAHSIVDKAAIVASEELTAVIASKHQWRRFNRRMSAWAKGVLAEALDPVCEQRNARHVLVNGAYTSQMDSTNGLLEGRREGDKFYRANGDVLQADHNAALNVLARLDDSEISRFTPYKEVRRILLARSPAQLSVKGLELGAQARQPSADKSYAQICVSF